MKPLQLDVWSDIACPWCYVGKRRMEKALESFDGEVELRWHSFELDPEAPIEVDASVSYVDRLARKYGRSAAEGQAMVDTMTKTGASEGIDFRFDRIQSSNTFDAHRLLHLALEHGVQDALKERLLVAYFSEGERMSDREVLARLAVEVGLPEDDVQDVLSTTRFAADVRQDEEDAAKIGIRGVPFFVVGGQYGLSGAQPVETLLEVLTKARSERGSLPTTDVEGEVCGPDGCA